MARRADRAGDVGDRRRAAQSGTVEYVSPSLKSEVEPVLVAVDFTADAVRLALADLDGELLLREAYPLPALPDEAAWAHEVGGRISTAFAHDGQKRSALAIAVACPGTVDPLTGRMKQSTGQEEWNGLAVVEALRRHIDAPIVALNRLHAALRGEAEHGAARGVTDAIYITLRGTPDAAIMTSSRIVSGATSRAGALPSVPILDAAEALGGDALSRTARQIAELAAFLDPAVLILDGVEAHLIPLLPTLQDLLDEIARGPRVVVSTLGEHAAILGALHAAEIVAFEGERRA
ncbi:MAG: ROK family protein [Dehalococcoidia bacterium]|nr:ROK family protein [Dehalococcoidia bacterium]